MAFLSTQNLLAPFHNKIHITTIVLAALILLMFRLSGGSVSTESQTIKTNKKDDTLNTELPRSKIFSKKNDNASDIENSFFFKESRKEVTNQKVPLKESNQPQTKPKKNSGGSNLDDVYNSLNF